MVVFYSKSIHGFIKNTHLVSYLMPKKRIK